MKIVLFTLVAILIPGLVSCAQPDYVLPEVVTIEADRNNYIPTMSSTVGIGLIPVYKIEIPSGTLQYHWRTNYGYFVAWDTPDFGVDVLEPEVFNTGEKIYWSYDPGEMGVDKPADIISLQIEDGQTQRVIAETNIKIGWEDRDVALLINQQTSNTPSGIVSPSPVQDYDSLVDNLHAAAGATVNPVGEVEQPFFSVKGFVISVNGNDVQVFEYSDAKTAENEAKIFSPDGSSIGTSIPFWVGSPHFYQVEKLIVLYVGENEYTIGILQSVLGPQFAGGAPYIPEDGLPLAPEVLIEGFAFNPTDLNVPVGTTVV
ncbi:hypothetical protein ACFLWG_04530 [Chloroflexota bacterium]